jgi:diadenosine tetraphosphate (Ap4A) HIT family hydrolase
MSPRLDSDPQHEQPELDCAFCSQDGAILRNNLAYARLDKYPVTSGHLLVIPVRHVASYFDCAPEEQQALWSLIEEARRLLEARHAPDGFNIGVNVGAASGQTIMHVHVHLIPRYRGDVADPRGGVRGVIPARQSYPVARGTPRA